MGTYSDTPDVSSTGINGSAKMVWQMIQATDTFAKYSTVGRFRNIPGRYWHGAVNQVINDLWPALNDRMLMEKEQAEEIKLALNRFLRHNQAVVCTRDGGLVKASMWFVATHWPELTVTPGPRKTEDAPVVTDEAATKSPTTVGKSAVTPLDVFTLHRSAAPPAPAVKEEKSEEAMTTDQSPVFQEPVADAVEDDETAEHKCRLDTCDETFAGVHWRATHEMKHGFRVNADGSVTDFDVNAPAPDEEQVQALIIKVCEGQEPMNQSQIVEAVRKDSPKAGTPTIKIVLQILADDGWFEVVNTMADSGTKGRTRRFKYVGQPVKKSAKKVAKPLAQVVEETVDKLVSGDADENKVERYRGLFEDLMADLTEIEKLKAQIERMEHSGNLVMEELKRTKKERDELRDRSVTREELDRVIKERNELQGTLDTLKKVFGSALQ